MNGLLMNVVTKMNLMAMQLMPLSGSATTDTLMGNIVKWAGTVAGALIAVFLIYSIAKDAFGYIKGSGDASVFKIVTKVIFLIFCIGLIIVAQNYQNLMGSAGNLANGVINAANSVAGDLIP